MFCGLVQQPLGRYRVGAQSVNAMFPHLGEITLNLLQAVIFAPVGFRAKRTISNAPQVELLFTSEEEFPVDPTTWVRSAPTGRGILTLVPRGTCLVDRRFHSKSRRLKSYDAIITLIICQRRIRNSNNRPIARQVAKGNPGICGQQ